MQILGVLGLILSVLDSVERPPNVPVSSEGIRMLKKKKKPCNVRVTFYLRQVAFKREKWAFNRPELCQLAKATKKSQDKVETRPHKCNFSLSLPR